jgi:hypothetical protein
LGSGRFIIVRDPGVERFWPKPVPDYMEVRQKWLLAQNTLLRLKTSPMIHTSKSMVAGGADVRAVNNIFVRDWKRLES